MNKIFSSLLIVCIAGIVNTSQAGMAHGADLHFPLVVTAGKMKYKTTACLPIVERKIDLSWDRFKASPKTTNDKNLVRLITAFENKDQKILKKLIHPQDKEVTRRQTDALFRQFEMIEVKKIKHRYEFGGFAVYFLQIKYGKSQLSSPFVFAKESNGKLTYAMQSPNFITILDIWYRSQWGPGTGKKPSYCVPPTKQKNIYQIFFEEKTPNEFKDQKYSLTVKGTRLDKGTKNSQNVKKLLKVYQLMSKSIKAEDVKNFSNFHTVRGKKKILSWYGKASRSEKNSFLKSVQDIFSKSPLYVVDAKPFYVLYTGKSWENIFYFIRNDKGQFKRSHYNQIHTTLDSIFKSNLIHDAFNR